MRNVLESKEAPKQGQDFSELKEMLDDFVLIAVHLAPLCDDVEHMVEVVKLALSSETQMQFLANVLKKAAKK